MRADVKVGIALGAILLVVGGWYYGAKKDKDIRVSDSEKLIRAENRRVLDDLFPQERSSEAASVARPTETGAAATGTGAAAPQQEREQGALSLLQRTLEDARVETHEAQLLTAEGAAESDAEATHWVDGDVAAGLSALRLDAPSVAEPPDSQEHEAANEEPARFAEPAQTARIHVIQRGETFAKLAERYYGSQAYAGVLVRANSDLDPQRLSIGTGVRVPPLSQSDAMVQLRAQRRGLDVESYTVAEGDTLYGIAQRLLGASSRWLEIYRLNKSLLGDDPARIRVGQVLTIPAQ